LLSSFLAAKVAAGFSRNLPGLRALWPPTSETFPQHPDLRVSLRLVDKVEPIRRPGDRARIDD
jgi:hypothetical protein